MDDNIDSSMVGVILRTNKRWGRNDRSNFFLAPNPKRKEWARAGNKRRTERKTGLHMRNKEYFRWQKVTHGWTTEASRHQPSRRRVGETAWRARQITSCLEIRPLQLPDVKSVNQPTLSFRCHRLEFFLVVLNQFSGGSRCLLHCTAAHFNINSGITNQQTFISLFFPSPLLSCCFILYETMGSHNDKGASRLWCSAPLQLPKYWFGAQQCTDSQREEVLGVKCGGRSDGAKRHFNSKVCLFHSNLI